ncbi:MAG: DUF2292 domain-containing protein [archaeon]
MKNKKIKQLSNELIKKLNIDYGEVKLIIHNKDVKKIEKKESIKLNK